jgi:hypothetical protein
MDTHTFPPRSIPICIDAHPTMSILPLVGYNHNAISNPKLSVVLVHMPIICVLTMTIVYCHNYGPMGWALLGSIILGLDLAYVLHIQCRLLSKLSIVESVGNNNIDIETNLSKEAFKCTINALANCVSANNDMDYDDIIVAAAMNRVVPV